MEMLYRAEIDRLDFSESHQSAAAQFQTRLLSQEDVQIKFSQEQISRFLVIFDVYQRQGGYTRERYMERVELEFRLDGDLSKQDL